MNDIKTNEYGTDLLSSSMRIFFAKIKKYDFDIIGMYLWIEVSKHKNCYLKHVHLLSL